MTHLNNVLAQLFDHIEEKCNVKFAEFCATASRPQVNRNIINKDQKFMKEYQMTKDNESYKYLYDPSLSFDFRFHQRLAQIKYDDRKEPWVTLIFNTEQISEPTRVNTHSIKGIEEFEEGVFFEYKTKKVTIPINMVLVSNDMTYLYGVQEKMLMYFDRFISFPYKESVQFKTGYEANWLIYGHASNIRQVNLNKLDTETRGSLTMSAWAFNLVYYVSSFPNGEPLYVLERIITKIKTRNNQEALEFTVDANTIV